MLWISEKDIVKKILYVSNIFQTKLSVKDFVPKTCFRFPKISNNFGKQIILLRKKTKNDSKNSSTFCKKFFEVINSVIQAENYLNVF